MKSIVSWKRRAVRALIVYAIDMAVAIAGWTWGFGLHVRSWWALLSLLIVARFFFHILQMAFAIDDGEAYDRRVHE